jgi:hypothetical protein
LVNGQPDGYNRDGSDDKGGTDTNRESGVLVIGEPSD